MRALALELDPEVQVERQKLSTTDLYYAAWTLAAVDGARLTGTSIDGRSGQVTFLVEGVWGDSNLKVVYESGGQVDGFAFVRAIRRLKRLACEGRPRS